MAKESYRNGLDVVAARQVRLWESAKLTALATLRKEAKMRGGLGPYVAISRGLGSGAMAVGEIVARRLGWAFFDRELVEHMASEANVRKSVIESLDEKSRDAIDEWITSIFDRESLTHNRYMKHLVTVLLTIARHGRAVIVGRGAGFLLPPESGLKVRIIAPLENRIAEIQRRRSLSYKDAKKELAARDKEMKEFYLRGYKKDVEDPQHYDLVLNTGLLSREACADIIVSALAVRLQGSEADIRCGCETLAS